jgi:hypothetical protein
MGQRGLYERLAALIVTAFSKACRPDVFWLSFVRTALKASPPDQWPCKLDHNCVAESRARRTEKARARLS